MVHDGDFSVHYSENRHSDSSWDCRWDRHPNAHNARLQFHHPPTGIDISDLDTASFHPLDTYSTVFEAIEQRIGSLW